MNRITRAAGESRILLAMRSAGRTSILCRTVVTILRPSLAWLGGPVAPETPEESTDAIERLWAIMRDSALIRVGLRGIAAVSHARGQSRAVVAYARFRDLEPHRRVQLAGWMLLAGTLTAGAGRAIFDRPWPGLSILVWLVILSGAVALVIGPRQVVAAWKGYRTE